MSRISLPGNNPKIYEVVVGYDPPMQCYFAQVYLKDQEEPAVWEVQASQAQALKVLEDYADMTNARAKDAYNKIEGDFDPGS